MNKLLSSHIFKPDEVSEQTTSSNELISPKPTTKTKSAKGDDIVSDADDLSDYEWPHSEEDVN